jgi:2-methylcitrate dehydratase PrpD
MALGQAPAVRRAPDVTGRLARYMVEARDRDLPAEVARQAKHRILDTLAAMVSGAHMTPGEAAIRYVRAQGGTPEASVLTTDIRTTAVNAAFANAMFAHADETDDFEPVTKAHPGSCVVPAALAVAERDGRSGAELLKAVTFTMRCPIPAVTRSPMRRRSASASPLKGGSSTPMARRWRMG